MKRFLILALLAGAVCGMQNKDPVIEFTFENQKYSMPKDYVKQNKKYIIRKYIFEGDPCSKALYKTFIEKDEEKTEFTFENNLYSVPKGFEENIEEIAQAYFLNPKHSKTCEALFKTFFMKNKKLMENIAHAFKINFSKLIILKNIFNINLSELQDLHKKYLKIKFKINELSFKTIGLSVKELKTVKFHFIQLSLIKDDEEFFKNRLNIDFLNNEFKNFISMPELNFFSQDKLMLLAYHKALIEIQELLKTFEKPEEKTLSEEQKSDQ